MGLRIGRGTIKNVWVTAFLGVASVVGLPFLAQSLETTANAAAIMAPTLQSPADGVVFKKSELPQTQSWSGNAGQTYRYESCSVDPGTSDCPSAKVISASNPTTNSRQIGTTAPLGDFWWHVQAKEGVSKSTWSSAWKVTIGTRPAVPTGLHRVAKNGGKNFACGASSVKQTLYPTWVANTESNFDHYEYTSINVNGSIGVNEQSLTTNQFEHDWIPSTEGRSGYKVRAVNDAGSKSDWSDVCYINYDNTAPAVSDVVVTPMTADKYIGGSVKVTMTIKDASDIKLSKTKLRFIGKNEQGEKVKSAAYKVVPTVAADRYAVTVDTSAFISDGLVGKNFRVRVDVEDAAGNKGHTVHAQGMKIDNTRPTMTLISPVNNSYSDNGDVIKVEGSVFDKGSGIDCVKVYIGKKTNNFTPDDDDPACQSGAAHEGDFTINLLNPDDDVYKVKVVVYDKVGNTHDEERIVTVDTQNPVVEITSPVKDQTVSKEVDLGGSITDATPVTYEYVLKSGDYEKSFSDFAGPQIDRKVLLTGLPSGKYTLTVTATDAAGHPGSNVVSFTVDHTAPQLSVSGPQEIKLDGSATFTVRSNESLNGDLPTIFINGVLFDGTLKQIAQNVWEFEYTPPRVASYKVVAMASDVYGNTSDADYADASFTLSVIANPPTTDQTSRASLRLQSASTALAQPLVVNTPPKTDKDDVEKPAVLGSETQTSDTDVPVIASSDKGWQIMGVAWYWILLALVVVAAGLWRAVVMYRRRQEQTA